MASVRKEDIPNEAQMMPMLWAAIKEFYIPEGTDEYWQAVLNQMNQIDTACHSRLGQKLMQAFIDYLEEKYGKAGYGQK